MQNLDYFSDFAKWSLKVYLSMKAESEIWISNLHDLVWLGLKSKHFRLEV